MQNDPTRTYFARPTRAHFDRLVKSERDAMLGAAWRVLGDPCAAEDVTQELFMRVLDANWGKEAIRNGRAFLIGKLIGLARTRLRGDRRRKQREQHAAREERAPDDPVASAVLHEVRDAVFELPDAPRECIELRYFGGLKVREIAEQLGCAARTVNDRLQAGRERLRGQLSAHSAAFLLPLLEQDLAPPAIEPNAQLQARLETLGERAFESGATSVFGGVLGYAFAATIVLTLTAVVSGWLTGSRSELEELAVLEGQSARSLEAPRVEPTAPDEPAFSGASIEDRAVITPVSRSSATGLRIHVRDEAGAEVAGATLQIKARKLTTMSAILALQEGDVSPAIEELLDPLELGDEIEFFVEGFPNTLCDLPFELGALAPGYATPIPVSFALIAGEVVEVEVRLPRPRRADLLIVDDETSEPVDGATVRSVTELERRDSDLSSTWKSDSPGIATSDVTGMARVDGLGAGLHQFEILATGYQLLVLRDQALEEATEVRLTPARATGRILVRVQDPSGDPIRDFPVKLRPVAMDTEWFVRTDRDGIATFADLSPDWYEASLPIMPFVELGVQRGYRATGAVSTTIALHEEVLAGADLELTLGYLPGTARWEVFVRDADGAPLAGESVTINGPAQVSLETDTDGRCEFEQLPAGEWRLSIGEFFTTFEYERPALEDGERRTDRISLGAARIAGGVVIDDSDAPPVRAFVMLRGAFTTSTHSVTGGQFSFERIPPGEYVLNCFVSGFALSREVIRVQQGAEGETVLVHMQRGGSVSVELADTWRSADTTLALLSPFGESVSLSPQDGDPTHFRSERSLPGTYTLTATCPDRGPFTATVKIANGADAEIVIE